MDCAHKNRPYWTTNRGINELKVPCRAHLRTSLLCPSLTVPVVDGEPALGTWQQVVLIDFDTGPRSREVVVQLVGE